MRDNVKDYISLFEKTLNLSGICWWIIDFEMNPDYYYCNDHMKDAFSLDRSLLYHSVEETSPIAGDYWKNIESACECDDQATRVSREYNQLINQEISEYCNEFPYHSSELNKTFYFSSRAKVLETNETNEVSIIYGIIEDITTAELQKKQIQESSEIIDKYVISTSSDAKGIITAASCACCKISGYTKDELIGSNHNILRHPDNPKEVFRQMWETIKKGEPWSGEFKNRKKDGSDYWVYGIITPQFDSNNKIKGYTSIRQNITDKKIIEELSRRDKLTNLYNRVKIDESINNEIKSSKRYNTKFSLILLDIDLFKDVNDNYGHLVGDSVLVQIAGVLKENIRQSDIVARWGGEEFIIVCTNSDIDAAEQLAQKLRVAIESLEFDIVKNITASFGVTQFKEKDTIHSLIDRTDKALYSAKDSGRNRVQKTLL